MDKFFSLLALAFVLLLCVVVTLVILSKNKLNKEELPSNLLLEQAAEFAADTHSVENLTSLHFKLPHMGAEIVASLAKVLPDVKSLASLDLGDTLINSAVAKDIFTIAQSNPNFVTKINGLPNSHEINAVVANNWKNLGQQVEREVSSLVDDHKFPVAVAGIKDKPKLSW